MIIMRGPTGAVDINTLYKVIRQSVGCTVQHWSNQKIEKRIEVQLQ